MKSRPRRISIFVLLLCAGSALAEPLPFQRALELAAGRAAAAGTAAANQLQARAAYFSARNRYLPQMVLGSGLGWTYGYPLSIEGSAPSIFNVNYQSTVFSPAQREYVRSAKVAWDATRFTSENERQDILLETAVTYIQLDILNQRMKALDQELEHASDLVAIVQARYEAGIEPQIELTRARLNQAQARMAEADAQGAAEVLRERLSQLTGLPSASLETVSDSIPPVPDPSGEDDLVAKALASSPALRAAEQQARAKKFQAQGAHKELYPSLDASAQYGLFSRFNNYDEFFRKFQRNNATVGVGIRFPFLSYEQRAQADQADAEALQAQRQVETTRNQISTQVLQLAQAAQQLAAAEQVAQLEYQLAQSQMEAIEARAQSAAPAPPGAAPASPRDVESARIAASQRYAAYLDTSFELRRARLQLLRAVGGLEDWALGRH